MYTNSCAYCDYQMMMSALTSMLYVSETEERWSAFTQFVWTMSEQIDPGGLVEMPDRTYFAGHLRRAMSRTETLAELLDSHDDVVVRTELEEMLKVAEDTLKHGNES